MLQECPPLQKTQVWGTFSVALSTKRSKPPKQCMAMKKKNLSRIDKDEETWGRHAMETVSQSAAAHTQARCVKRIFGGRTYL